MMKLRRGAIGAAFLSILLALFALSVKESSPASAQAAPTPVNDLVFLVDGSGSIDSNDFAIQIDGITTALQDQNLIPPDGSFAVSLIQWSDTARVELPRTVLTNQASINSAVATINAISQIGRGTSPHLGINAFTQVLPELTTGTQTLCLSTDGTPSSQTMLESSASAADAAGVDRLTVLAIEDGGFTSAVAQQRYGPAVFGGGSVVTTRNAACLLYTSPSPRDRG